MKITLYPLVRAKSAKTVLDKESLREVKALLDSSSGGRGRGDRLQKNLLTVVRDIVTL